MSMPCEKCGNPVKKNFIETTHGRKLIITCNNNHIRPTTLIEKTNTIIENIYDIGLENYNGEFDDFIDEIKREISTDYHICYISDFFRIRPSNNDEYKNGYAIHNILEYMCISHELYHDNTKEKIYCNCSIKNEPNSHIVINITLENEDFDEDFDEEFIKIRKGILGVGMLLIIIILNNIASNA